MSENNNNEDGDKECIFKVGEECRLDDVYVYPVNINDSKWLGTTMMRIYELYKACIGGEVLDSIAEEINRERLHGGKK
jgi:hypothetical protein